MNEEARFLAKVRRSQDHWIWTGATDYTYGTFRYEGKMTRAYRAAWLIFRGPIPDGCEIDHRCRISLCVNPDHLEPVTHQVNVLRGDAPAAVNARKTRCPRGHPYDVVEGNRRRCRRCRKLQRSRHVSQ